MTRGGQFDKQLCNLLEHIPKRSHTYRHKGNGKLYRILYVTNTDAVDVEKWPRTVVYREIDGPSVWSQPLTTFLQKFEFEFDYLPRRSPCPNPYL